MPFNTTNNEIYIVEVQPPFERLAFQFMPEGVSYSRTANIQSIDVVGRNNNLYQYTGGTDVLKFSLDFFSDEQNRKDVKRKVDWLKSLTMSDGGFGPARNVKIIMGDMFKNDVFIVREVDAVFSNFDNRFNYNPIRATVKLSFVLDPKKNRRLKDVRK